MFLLIKSTQPTPSEERELYTDTLVGSTRLAYSGKPSFVYPHMSRVVFLSLRSTLECRVCGNFFVVRVRQCRASVHGSRNPLKECATHLGFLQPTRCSHLTVPSKPVFETALGKFTTPQS